MGAIRMLARNQLRRRWRSALVMTMLVGFVGGIVLVTLAGARRASSSLTRFDQSSSAATLEILPPLFERPTRAQLATLRHVPNVAALSELRAVAVNAPVAPTIGMAAQRDDALGRDIDRGRLLAGREANQDAPDEITISESLAKMLHRGVGDHLDVVSYTPKQVQASTGPPPEPLGPKVRLRIVGVVRRPFDLGDLSAIGGNIPLTRAFDRVYDHRIGDFGVIIRVRTKHGAADDAAVTAVAKNVFPAVGQLNASSQSLASETAGAQNAIDVVTAALAVLAAIAALAGAITVAIVMTREIGATDDYATLRALGLRRRARAAINAPLVAIVAIGGAVLALVAAVAASPLLPIGDARRADPDVGFHFDAPVLIPGAAAIVLLVLGVGFLASMRAARRGAFDTSDERRSPALASASARLRPASATGLQFALVPGRGRTAVPVRSALFGAIAGVVGIVAVAVFAASLNTLVTTPRDYGLRWGFKTADTSFDPRNGCASNTRDVARLDGVRSLAIVCDNDIQLDRRPVTTWGITRVRGSISPEIVSGRAPRTADEIALGAKTMHALQRHIGDLVTGHSPTGTPARYRVVGQVVLPTLGYPQPLANGAVVTGDGLARVYDANARATRYLIGTFAPGADHRAIEQRLVATGRFSPLQRTALPVEVDRIHKVNWVPVTLALLLIVLELVAIGHALVTAARRRRHELAVLKVLGFKRRQVRASVAWQASILGGIGLVFGIPLGIVAGRAAWRIVADGLGVSAPATLTVPALWLVAGAAATLALVNLVAVIPARWAARVDTARTLRSE